MRRKLRQAASKPEQEALMRICINQLAQVYFASAIRNTPIGKNREYEVSEKSYGKINADEVSAKEYRTAKAQGTRSVKRVKRKKGKQHYFVLGTSEHMRRSWEAGDLEKKGNTYQVKIGNSAFYASFVNDGHRQKPGRFVPAIGKRLVKSWVPGQHMAEKAEDQVRKKQENILRSNIDTFLRRLGDDG